MQTVVVSGTPTKTVSGTVSGTVALVDVPGVTLTGTLAASFDTQAATQVVVTGTNIVIGVAGQQLSAAKVTFSKSATSVSLTLVDGELSFADASGTPLVRATDIDGSLTMVSGGVFGSISGLIALDVPAVSFAGRMAVQFNTTTGVQATIPAKTVRLTASNVHLVIAGQEIGGTFVVAVQTIGGADNNLSTLGDNEQVISIVIADLTLKVGPPASPFINVTADNHWSGAMLLTSKGTAATFSGSLTNVLNLPGNIVLSGSVSLKINTGTVAVNRTFVVDVPATTTGGTAQPARSIVLGSPGRSVPPLRVQRRLAVGPGRHVQRQLRHRAADPRRTSSPRPR